MQETNLGEKSKMALIQAKALSEIKHKNPNNQYTEKHEERLWLTQPTRDKGNEGNKRTDQDKQKHRDSYTQGRQG